MIIKPQEPTKGSLPIPEKFIKLYGARMASYEGIDFPYPLTVSVQKELGEILKSTYKNGTLLKADKTSWTVKAYGNIGNFIAAHPFCIAARVVKILQAQNKPSVSKTVSAAMTAATSNTLSQAGAAIASALKKKQLAGQTVAKSQASQAKAQIEKIKKTISTTLAQKKTQAAKQQTVKVPSVIELTNYLPKFAEKLIQYSQGKQVSFSTLDKMIFMPTMKVAYMGIMAISMFNQLPVMVVDKIITGNKAVSFLDWSKVFAKFGLIPQTQVKSKDYVRRRLMITMIDSKEVTASYSNIVPFNLLYFPYCEDVPYAGVLNNFNISPFMPYGFYLLIENAIAELKSQGKIKGELFWSGILCSPAAKEALGISWHPVFINCSFTKQVAWKYVYTNNGFFWNQLSVNT